MHDQEQEKYLMKDKAFDKVSESGGYFG